MNNLVKVAVLGGALAFGLSGCATIIEGKTSKVTVNTAPVDGAKCTLQNAIGTWYVTTPGMAEVHKSKTDLNVTCSKDGYQDSHQTMYSHFEGMTAGNLLVGGFIGAGVDAASGAMNYYDPTVQMTMLPVGAAPAPVAQAPSTGKPTS